MGLACSQIRLLTLTARKADCEYGISVDSIKKMALTREMNNLTQEYRSRLQSKQVSYYANGQYNKMNYQYLMGYGENFAPVLNGNYPLKEKNNMLLTDYNGRVVMSDAYAKAITSVLGSGAMAANGQGGTFSHDEIPRILAALANNVFSAEDIQAVVDEEKINSSYNTHGVNTMSGQENGTIGESDNSDNVTSAVQKFVDFYYPIFAAAASNGWTTEYNKEMAANDDYISDAIVSGGFQLATVNVAGEYNEGESLSYFLTAGYVMENNSSDVREDITTWYNAEKERISEKETYLDLHIDDLSTELEAIKTEMQSIQSLIDDAISSVFDWGSS